LHMHEEGEGTGIRCKQRCKLSFMSTGPAAAASPPAASLDLSPQGHRRASIDHSIIVKGGPHRDVERLLAIGQWQASTTLLALRLDGTHGAEILHAQPAGMYPGQEAGA